MPRSLSRLKGSIRSSIQALSARNGGSVQLTFRRSAASFVRLWMLPAAPKAASVRSERESRGFRPYYVLDWSEGVGFAVMMFEDRESANGSARVHFNLCA